MGAPGKLLTCVVCDAELEPLARLDSMFCSTACNHTSERAKKYGVKGRDLYRMIRESTGCAICGVATDDLHVDHNHATGRMRALLCGQCNVGLGMFKEDPSRLQSAIAYLQRHATLAQSEMPPIGA